MVEELAARIDEISDGVVVNRQSTMLGGKAGMSKPMEIRVDTMDPGKCLIQKKQLILSFLTYTFVVSHSKTHKFLCPLLNLLNV